MSAREKQAEQIVAQKINSNTPSIMAFEAACLLFAIEGGAAPATIQHKAIFQKINQCAKKNGPHGKWLRARDFLEEFISAHAPGWNWREDARQGEVEDRNYQRENERIAKEIAEDARWGMARATKFYTPNAPDPVLLCALAWEWRKKRVKDPDARHWWENVKRYRVTRTTWPTLQELKLATAISGRTLGKIIRNLQPKKTEMTKEPRIVPRTFDASRRRFSRRGAVPLRYGPRLVVGVLNEFVNRLPEFLMDDEERRRLQKMALRVKRAFVAKLTHSRSKHLARLRELIRSAGSKRANVSIYERL
jgi:hypothetical protein